MNAAVLAAGIACAVTGTPTAYQWLLLCLLGRPMLAFVFVLGTLRQSAA